MLGATAGNTLMNDLVLEESKHLVEKKIMRSNEEPGVAGVSARG